MRFRSPIPSMIEQGGLSICEGLYGATPDTLEVGEGNQFTRARVLFPLACVEEGGQFLAL